MQIDFISAEDHLRSIGWLDHSPRRPYPRSDMIGEQVYVERWKALMVGPLEDTPVDCNELATAPNAQLYWILRYHPQRLNQRQATVCASMICWFGTNIGSLFVESAVTLSNILTIPSHKAFRMAWAAENTRVVGIDGGRRRMEHIIYGPDYIEAPDTVITHYDWETIDLLLAWCDTSGGKMFISSCLVEIARRQGIERKKRLESVGKMGKMGKT
jgi:hypothetical protein